MSPTDRLTPEACLADCTPSQQEAIQHRDGPLLVLAGAGSGKTRVITRRIGYLISTGVAPHDILAITFTNKAADEMKERVIALCGEGGVWLSTFHSMCARMLRHHAERAGLRPEFSIYDTSDSIAAIREALKEIDLSAENFTPGNIARAISTAKSALKTPEAYAEEANTLFAQAVARVYRKYADTLKANNAVDFDDLLMKIVVLLRDDAEVRERYQERFRYLLIDEYQDTNHAQYVITQALAAKHRNICVTGDPDQSIYGWRGADIRNILAFEKDYPDAKVVRLEQNYRSTKVILRAASALITQNEQRKEKELWTENPEGARLRLFVCADERDEANAVARDIITKARNGARFGDCAVFYRTNAQSRSLEGSLRDSGVPYSIVAGTSFFDRREIRDLVGYLRVCSNPGDDLSLCRVINVPPRGIGGRSVERLQEWGRANGKSLREALAFPQEGGLKGPQVTAARQVDAVFTAMAQHLKEPVADILRTLIEQTEYLPYVRMSLSDAEDRENNVQELVNAAAEFDRSFPEGGLTGFLERVALVSDQDAYDSASGSVALMTLHAAKGLEFPFCYIVGLEDSLLPLGAADEGRDLEEERRLFFVGLTRAKQEVVLCAAVERSRFGQRQYNPLSPFLGELGEDVLDKSQMAMVTSSFSAERTMPVQEGRHVEYYHDTDGSEPRGLNPRRRFTPPAPKPPAPAKKAEGDDLIEGDWVEHGTFGRGQVLGLSGSGESRTALIRFPVGGTKLIALRYKKLRKL